MSNHEESRELGVVNTDFFEGEDVDKEVKRTVQHMTEQPIPSFSDHDTVSDFLALQLSARDMEIGLRAELLQSKRELLVAKDQIVQVTAAFRRSRTWRAGEAVLFPLKLAKRVLASIRRLFR